MTHAIVEFVTWVVESVRWLELALENEESSREQDAIEAYREAIASLHRAEAFDHTERVVIVGECARVLEDRVHRLECKGWMGKQRRKMPEAEHQEEQDDQTTLAELRQMINVSHPTSKLKDVVGNAEAKRALLEAVILPTLLPHLFQGIREPWLGVLLAGPPGTGKTMLTEAVAGEAKIALLSVSPAGILSKWTGEAEKNVCRLFTLARHMAPCILFMDEVDSLATSRTLMSEGDGNGARRVLTEFLLQLNSLRPADRVVVVSATNRPKDLDKAFLRRMPIRITIPLPSHKERLDLLHKYLSNVPSSLAEEDLSAIAGKTEHFSGTDMRDLVREAAMGPVRELYSHNNLDDVTSLVSSLKRTAGDELVTPRNVYYCDFESALAHRS